MTSVVAEKTPGPTPSGGAYAVIRYLNDDGEEVPRHTASIVEFSECTEDGEVIAVTTGYLTRGPASAA